MPVVTLSSDPAHTRLRSSGPLPGCETKVDIALSLHALTRLASLGGTDEGVRPYTIAQIPAYQAYPPSGEDEPKPLPNGLRVSVRVRRVMYLTFL